MLHKQSSIRFVKTSFYFRLTFTIKLFCLGSYQVLRVAYQEEGGADQAARGPQDRVGKPQGNHFFHSISRINDDWYSAKQEMLKPRLIQ